MGKSLLKQKFHIYYKSDNNNLVKLVLKNCLNSIEDCE